ncbi:MAG: TolC family protein [Polyangiaceae bacterium]|nr:TolC family protein [Polyangiaceae bacterium]
MTLPATLLATTVASAQPAAQPAQPPTAAPPTMDLGPGKDAVKDKPDPLAEALAVQPGGLTFEMAGREAVTTSNAVHSKEAELEGAQGAVSSATVSFFPRLTLSASYTRLSEVEQGSIGGGGGILGAANEGPVGVGPCPDNPANQCVLDSGGLPVQAVSFTFPQVLNQIAFSAGLTIPISDYFLRSIQAYNAADHNEDSLEMAVEAQRLTTATEAKIAVLNWILAKGQVVVAHMSVEQANAQLADAKALRKAEKGSEADVMRIEALVAQSEFTETEARSNEVIAEQRLRVILHTPATRQLAIGVDVLATPATPALPGVDALIAEAVRNRLEILSTEEQRLALENLESVTEAGYWPRLDGFADVLVANPNSRVFPQQERFDATWDVGVRLTWVVNDTFSTIGSAKQAKSRTAQLDAQKLALIDSIRLEVIQAHADLLKAAPQIEAANRGVAAAEETLRITKLLFAVGNGTSTALADAENSLTVARLRKLAAHVGLHGSIVRLQHATGRDRAMAPVK